MNKIVFCFIVITLLLLQVEQLQNPILETVKIATCIFMILTFGVSHGAIDNILYGSKSGWENSKFIAVYVLVAAVNILLWMVEPNLAFIIFMLISSYHFGQSQLVDYKFSNWIIEKALYFCWGALVLVGLIHFNIPEIVELSYHHAYDLPFMDHLVNYSIILFPSFLVITAGLLIGQFLFNHLSGQKLLMEAYQFLLIVLAFKMCSLLVGFTLYFIILHSYRVLNQEFEYLKDSINLKSKLQFLKMLLPFTLLSIVGTGLILLLLVYLEIEVSWPILALILTSSVTLPHTYVMEIFYKSRLMQ